VAEAEISGKRRHGTTGAASPDGPEGGPKVKELQAQLKAAQVAKAQTEAKIKVGTNAMMTLSIISPESSLGSSFSSPFSGSL
jgi:hypothetical protein